MTIPSLTRFVVPNATGLQGAAGLLENLVIANIWQSLVSILYTSFTIILTSQLVARELAAYATTRKALRVSKPRGEQRSTYFVSMPYRYGVPIIVIFAIEHWLPSQSSFVIRLLYFDWDGTPLPGRTTAGFSVAPSILALVLTALIFTTYTLNGIFRRYPTGPQMPLVCTNSLAISANCQPPETDKNAHLEKVAWGVYESGRESADGRKCSFTSKEVAPPGDETRIIGLAEDGQPRRLARPQDWEDWWYSRLGVFAGP